MVGEQGVERAEVAGIGAFVPGRYRAVQRLALHERHGFIRDIARDDMLEQIGEVRFRCFERREIQGGKRSEMPAHRVTLAVNRMRLTHHPLPKRTPDH